MKIPSNLNMDQAAVSSFSLSLSLHRSNLYLPFFHPSLLFCNEGTSRDMDDKFSGCSYFSISRLITLLSPLPVSEITAAFISTYVSLLCGEQLLHWVGGIQGMSRYQKSLPPPPTPFFIVFAHLASTFL